MCHGRRVNKPASGAADGGPIAEIWKISLPTDLNITTHAKSQTNAILLLLRYGHIFTVHYVYFMRGMICKTYRKCVQRKKACAVVGDASRQNLIIFFNSLETRTVWIGYEIHKNNCNPKNTIHILRIHLKRDHNLEFINNYNALSVVSHCCRIFWLMFIKEYLIKRVKFVLDIICNLLIMLQSIYKFI